MILINLLVLAFLIITAFIDLTKKEIPSIMTSGALLVLALLNLHNLTFGILAFIFAIFLLEADFYSGLADVKVVALLGLLISDLSVFLLFIFLVTFIGVAYKIFIILVFKKNWKDEVPFLPVLVLVYAIMLVISAV